MRRSWFHHSRSPLRENLTDSAFHFPPNAFSSFFSSECLSRRRRRRKKIPSLRLSAGKLGTKVKLLLLGTQKNLLQPVAPLIFLSGVFRNCFESFVDLFRSRRASIEQKMTQFHVVAFLLSFIFNASKRGPSGSN